MTGPRHQPPSSAQLAPFLWGAPARCAFTCDTFVLPRKRRSRASTSRTWPCPRSPPGLPAVRASRPKGRGPEARRARVSGAIVRCVVERISFVDVARQQDTLVCDWRAAISLACLEAKRTRKHDVIVFSTTAFGRFNGTVGRQAPAFRDLVDVLQSQRHRLTTQRREGNHMTGSGDA